MNGKIRVHVVQYRDCKNLVMRYKDPVTGKYERSTKYRDPQTGIETETGDNRKHARKLAALWEADLNAGRDQGRHSTSWGQFRQRYEDEVLPGLAVRTGDKIGTVFDALENALPRVAGGRLADLNAEALSRFQAVLRDGKRSESTIAGYLAHLRAALQWAADQGMIPAVPKMKRPKRAKRQGRGSKSKGRPITAEEFDRMLANVRLALVERKQRKREVERASRRKARQRAGKPASNRPTYDAPVEISPAVVESWRHFLTGLWLSGLRLEESTNLYWDRPDRLCIDLSGKRPRLSIPAELEKGGRDRLLPITPDFAEFLLATPAPERRGRVFRPIASTGIANKDQAGRLVALVGELARIVVHTHPATGAVKYASAHDLRRSFGSRWARKVSTATLQKLMRHESIETTMRYYVDLDADELAEDLWQRHEAERGTVFGTVGQNEAAENG